MTRKMLITCSIIRDALNWMVVGQVPGLCQILDLPLLIMHYRYAGASASFTLLELIPMVGFVPIFSIAAFSYPDPAEPAAPRVEQVRVRAVPPPVPQPRLFAEVDGKIVPIELTPEQQQKVARHVYGQSGGGDRHG